MKIEEVNALLFDRKGPMESPSVTPYHAPQIAPQAPNNAQIVEVPAPLKDSDFNGLSIQDVAAMHKFKNMDSLHRADAVSAQYERGARLNEYFGETAKKANLNPEQTAELIRSHYFKNK